MTDNEREDHDKNVKGYNSYHEFLNLLFFRIQRMIYHFF